MITRGITKTDFDYIVSVIDRWWGGPGGEKVHPMFFYEFGGEALIVEDDGQVVGFLFGFTCHNLPPVGYVHLVGIHPNYRRRGVGRLLYEQFIERCRTAGAKRMKAITNVGNDSSIEFHKALGFSALEDPNYAGMDRARVVFSKEL